MKTLHEHRRDVIEICRRIHARGWISAADGNVSIRLPNGRLLTTPSGMHKGYIGERDLVLCDLQGRRVAGPRQPSSEIAMHVAVYEDRPDVQAVVHAHPTYCIAFSLAGVTLAQCLLPEIVFTFGSIPTTEYCTPTTEEVPREVRKLIRDYDAMILDRHGSLTVGATVFEAYDKLERMEHVAEITHAASQLGEVRPLSREQVEHLLEVGRGLGIEPRKVTLPCEQCNACAHGHLPRRSADAPVWPPTGPPPAARKLVFDDGRAATGVAAGAAVGANGGAGSGAAAAPTGLDAATVRIIAEEVARALQNGRSPTVHTGSGPAIAADPAVPSTSAATRRSA
jgi:L-fuculose-phosphate aldolase